MGIQPYIINRPNRVSSILYILPYLEAGGTERHTLHLVQSMRNKARIALLSPPGVMLDQFVALNVEHRSFPRLERDFLRGIREFRRNLRALLSDFQPDVIHVHAAPELTLLVRTVARKIPTVLTLHGFAVANPEANYKLARLLTRLGRTGRIIAVSEAEAKMFRGDSAETDNVRVVYNGIPDLTEKPVDWRAKLDWPSDEPIIGAVGRLEKVKGFDLLLEAFATLSSGVKGGSQGKLSSPRLVIVGDGSERNALERQIAELGLSDRVHLAGFMKDAHRAPGGFDVMVIPSRQEALPLACLEAMAAACPVVASDVGGLPEVVEHGRTGYLFPSGDVKSLTKTLQKLLGDLVQARAMGDQGRKKFLKHFHVDVMTANTLAVYKELLALAA